MPVSYDLVHVGGVVPPDNIGFHLPVVLTSIDCIMYTNLGIFDTLGFFFFGLNMHIKFVARLCQVSEKFEGLQEDNSKHPSCWFH